VKIAEETDLEAKLEKCDEKLNCITEREAKLEVDIANFRQKSSDHEKD
jgi:hypothetical protein